jgi:hypothetical protein
VLPLVEARQQGWPAWTWVSLGASALFGIRTLRTGLLTQLSFWCGQAALFLVLALYLQVGNELGQHRSDMLLAQRQDMVEALAA